MLPIRLGMLNADGPQELFVFALTETGRIETTNYRTTKLPTGMDVPLYVKDTFGDFYKAMFDHQVQEKKMTTVFEEYAWDMGWCDPCAAEPLTPRRNSKGSAFSGSTARTAARWSRPGGTRRRPDADTADGQRARRTCS